MTLSFVRVAQTIRHGHKIVQFAARQSHGNPRVQHLTDVQTALDFCETEFERDAEGERTWTYRLLEKSETQLQMEPRSAEAPTRAQPRVWFELDIYVRDGEALLFAQRWCHRRLG